MLKLHITNSEQRDANVKVGGVKPPAPPTLGITDGTIGFRRYVTSAPSGLHDALVEQFGDDYGQALVDGDPEVDAEGKRWVRLYCGCTACSACGRPSSPSLMR